VLTVPKPLNIDWNAIQSLFLQGIPPATIAKQTGLSVNTVQKRASRKGWVAIRDRVKVDLSKPLRDTLAMQVAQAQSNAIAKASAQAQTAFAEEVNAQAKLLRSKPARRLSDLSSTPKRQGRAAVVSTLVNAAAKLYGWDAQSSQPSHVSLTKIDVHSDTKPTKPDQPAVDVPYE